MVNRFAMVCRIAALLTMMIAAAAIAGWVLNSPLLTSVGSSYIPMAPNTAACFFCGDQPDGFLQFFVGHYPILA